MKVWITRYAHTKGIFELEVEATEPSSYGAVRPVASGSDTYYLASEYAMTERGAATVALARIESKRTSIARTLAKLNALEDRMRAVLKGAKSP